MTFEELGLIRQLLNAVEDLGFSDPTPIQLQAIPVVKGGQHVIGIAQTGTGKTAAYMLPLLQLLKYAQGQAPRLAIIVPTKELVVQVVTQAKELAKYTDLRILGLFGGVGRQKQIQPFREQNGVDIVVATPKRLLEMYEEEELPLNKIQHLVLDEADRMLDMGFLPQINLLLDILPRKKQNLLFSATFSPAVEELSWNFMDFPTKIEVAPEATPVETVEQRCYETPNRATKLDLLEHLLAQPEWQRVIVFVKTKESATEIYERLVRRVKGKVQLIHSNKSQNTRIHAFNTFKEGLIRVLVATDVMARGIDIPEVSHVVNFDVPIVHEDYVHRIGRTGRAMRTGCAVTFMTMADEYHVEKIEAKIRMKIPRAMIPDGVAIHATPFEEEQAMLRAIDGQRRKEDPDFQGAFHEKKDFKQKRKEKSKKKPKQFKSKVKSFFASSTPKKKDKTSKHFRHKE